jgi:hypothetical protein
MAGTGTFTADVLGDAGNWSGGGRRLTMTWTAGTDSGFVFMGTFTLTPRAQYIGSFNTGETARVVKGEIHNYRGHAC